MSEWAHLDSRARQLESNIDDQITRLSEIGQDAASRSSTSPGAGFNAVEGQIDTLNTQLERSLKELRGLINRMADAATDPTSESVLLGHRSRLSGIERDFRRVSGRIRDARNRAELLPSVQRDIDSYKTAEQERQDAYLSERQAIENSMRGANDAISIAIAARDGLISQRGIVTQMQSKLTDVAEKFPALNNVIKKINFRKTRDQFIMAGVCSTCIIFILWYSFR
mmetsp:Transcript_10291/g.26363  ORF Transcript_10291/g.26363 Transcript_10291/m.26363 type:complete len:225 (+) Transcript_10291:136-810(+)